MFFQGAEVAWAEGFVCCSGVPTFDITSLVGEFRYENDSAIWDVEGSLILSDNNLQVREEAIFNMSAMS